MTVAQSLSSNAHFFFLFFSSSFPFVVRFLLLHFNRRRHCLNVAFEANDYFKLLSCDKEPCHLATRGNLFDRRDTGRSVPHLKKKDFQLQLPFSSERSEDSLSVPLKSCNIQGTSTHREGGGGGTGNTFLAITQKIAHARLPANPARILATAHTLAGHDQAPRCATVDECFT